MKTCIIIILFFVSFIAAGQPVVRREFNLPRAGDRVVKQQVEYKDPGRAGANVVWDFGQLKAVNAEYRLSYSEPRRNFRTGSYILGCDTFPAADSLLVGREHFTNYFYREHDSILYLLG
jgi:hypothetical protein